MMYAHTTHTIVDLGLDVMVVTDSATSPDQAGSNALVSAHRRGCCGGEHTWVVSGKGQEDVSVATRSEAVHEMKEMTVRMCPEDTYSFTVPHGLRQIP